MKILNLEINTRVHFTLNFDAAQRKNVSFIINKEIGSALFSYRKMHNGQVVVSMESGYALCNVYYQLQNNVLYVTLKEESRTRVTNESEVFSLRDYEDLPGFDETAEKLQVVFKLCLANKTCRERYIDLIFCKEERTYNVVLDFGSEASQMSIVERGTTIGLNSISTIFTNIKHHYQTDDRTNDEAYVQYAGTPLLYRSFYYIRKKFDLQETPSPSDPDSHDLISFLSRRNDLDSLNKEFIALPNAKIASFGGVITPSITVNGNDLHIEDFGDDYFYRKAINLFVYEALSIIRLRHPGTHKAVNLCILVPNVYPLTMINKKLAALFDDVRKMLERDEFRDIIGFELCQVSESDASMLGLFAANPLQAFDASDGNYLIMDAGKGTLDFSILKYDPRNPKQYKNLCRSGIIGAGNAVTYAIALALVYDFLQQNCEDFDEKKADDQVRSVLFNVVLKADMAEQFDFLREVEAYKVRYNENRFSEEEEPVDLTTKIDEVRLTGITNYISRLQYRIADPRGYVTNEIRSIVLDVLSKLKEITNRVGRSKDQIIHIDRVIFTGRGFLMKQLQDEMMVALLTIEPRIERIRIREAGHEKDICLYISYVLSGGSYDVSLDGTPMLLKRNPTVGMQQAEPNLKMSLWERFIRSWAPTDKEATPGEQEVIRKQYVPNIISQSMSSLEGMTVSFASYADIINIGGTSSS